MKIDDVEYRLKRYRVDKSNIDNLKLMLSNIKLEDGLSGIGYGERIRSSGVSSPVENAVIKAEEEAEKIEKRITILENNIKMIDNALDALTEEERTVITGRYFEGLQWWQIASTLKYAESWCRGLRKEALAKMHDTFNKVALY